MVPPAVFGRLDITVTSHAGGDYRSQQGRHFSGRETVRAQFCRSAVADNTLTIKQKSTLPVSRTRQDKSLFRSLSGAYLPPVESGLCRPALQPPRHHGLPPHLRHYYPPPAPACARRPFCTTTCAAATAACGPGAKMSSRTPQGRFLYRTVRRGRPVRQEA